MILVAGWTWICSFVYYTGRKSHIFDDFSGRLDMNMDLRFRVLHGEEIGHFWF